MRIEIDKSSGFCWGVIRTIEIAERELKSGEPMYSLGDIIHNPMENERLRKKGLEVISHSELERLRGKKLLIRAHGEPPETYRKAEQLGITIIDATCPVVAKVQERIRRFYLDGYQIVIFGKIDHPEVIGLVGQTNGEAIVIKNIEEIEKINLAKKTVLFSQTTMDKRTFYAIRDELVKRMQNLGGEAIEFQAKDTICGQFSRREDKIREFAKMHDVVLFVAGRKSSNGKVLFNSVHSVNPRSYYVEDSTEIQNVWFDGAESIGITGATSTPQWLMEEIKEELEYTFIQQSS